LPTISMFFGIMVRMYYDDHGPAHFHAYYGDDMIVIEIATLRIVAGQLPKRAQAMVLEWASQHREELLEDWQLASAHEPLKKISPLE
jgi:hypothetical protein